MSRRDIALLFDRLELPREACVAYELALDEPDASPDLYFNLAVLYFDLADYGTARSLDLHPEFSALASERCRAILDAAEARYGSLPEAQFWRRYFDAVQLGKPDFEGECAELVRTSGSITPVFYLFLYDEDTYLTQANELASRVSAGATAKDRYIRSVLEAEFARRAARSWTR